MKLIVAMDQNYGIGKDGGIPWVCKEDMRFFRFLTVGNPIIMGRKTQDSLKKPLEFRTNFVLSHDYENVKDGFQWINENQILMMRPYQTSGFVIGGASLYKLCCDHNLIDEIYLSRIKGEHDCDTFFLDIPQVLKKFDLVADIKIAANCSIEKWLIKRKVREA